MNHKSFIYLALFVISSATFGQSQNIKIGELNSYKVFPAFLERPAARGAYSAGSQARQEARGDRVSELRVRPVGDRVVQKAAVASAARGGVRRRAGAGARQDRRRRGGPGARGRQARRHL